MIRLHVSFDREDRCYEFGDEVTGNVAVEAASHMDCSAVAITHGWVTRGWGFQDGQHERHILSTRITELRPDQCMRFPFRFRVPNGPVTYHGHNVNVDWYVRAQAKAAGRELQEEQDFLVVGGRPTGTILLGTKEVEQEEIPTAFTEPVADPLGTVELSPGSPTKQWIGSAGKAILSFVFYVILFELVLIGFSALSAASSTGLMLIGAAIALGWLWYFGPKAFHSISHRRLELREFWLKPEMAYRGSRVHCHMEFSTRAALHLQDIKVTMFAQERVTRPARSASATNYHTLHARSFLRSFEVELAAGRHFAFDYPLSVDNDTPPTFSSKNNGLDWYVTVQLGLRGWPDIVETLPLTVLP